MLAHCEWSGFVDERLLRIVLVKGRACGMIPSMNESSEPLQAEDLAAANPLLAHGAILVATMVGAGVWAGITYVTGYEVGYVAIGVGALCGWACVQVGGRGQQLAITAGVFALVAILCGKYVAHEASISNSLEVARPLFEADYDETVR